MGVAHVTTLKDGSWVFSTSTGGSSGGRWGAVGIGLVGVEGAGAGTVAVGLVLAPLNAGSAAMQVRISVSCLRAVTWLSVSGANGEPSKGLCRAATMSQMLVRIRSLDDVSGIVILEGNQDTVSQMCSTCVSHTQIV